MKGIMYKYSVIEMKRDERIKLEEIRRKIQQVKAYNDKKFLKDKERNRAMDTIEYLKKQKEMLIFKSTIENMMEGRLK